MFLTYVSDRGMLSRPSVGGSQMDVAIAVVTGFSNLSSDPSFQEAVKQA